MVERPGRGQVADTDSEWLTTGQAARYCSVKPDTVLKWIKKGRIQARRTAGGHYRIARRNLEPLVTHVSPVAETPGAELALPAGGPPMRCWEFLSPNGEPTSNCKQCVVYRVRASWCFQMANMGQEVGHARQFCHNSCQECAYYRQVTGQSSNVLVVTTDETLIDRLEREENGAVRFKFARNGYEASALMDDFKPGYVVIDIERIPAIETGLIDSLANDPRFPGLKVVLAVAHGMAASARAKVDSKLVTTVLEKPFGSRRIATVVGNVAVERHRLGPVEPD